VTVWYINLENELLIRNNALKLDRLRPDRDNGYSNIFKRPVG